MALAARIAAMSPLTLKITRKFIYDVADLDFEDVPEAALKVVSEAFETEDSKEARRAFKEKRKPEWKGR
jgi:enoyl-CoA hydratase/carnithine racemase